jgi:hypothetical protein
MAGTSFPAALGFQTGQLSPVFPMIVDRPLCDPKPVVQVADRIGCSWPK